MPKPKSEMTRHKPPKAAQPNKLRRDDPEQSKLFIQKARALGADRESSSDLLVGQLARTPPQPRFKKSRKGSAKS